VHVDGRLLLPFGIVGVGMAGRAFDDIGKGVRYSELMPGGFDPRARLVDMDAEGIDTAVLYPSIGLFLEAVEDPVLGEACCRVYNDWLADYCRAAPERLIGIAAVADAGRPRAPCASCSAPAARSACAARSSVPTRATGGRCTIRTSIRSGRRPPRPACRSASTPPGRAICRRAAGVAARRTDHGPSVDLLHRQLHRLLANGVRRCAATPPEA
jgi:hypothetical protein